MDDEDDGDEAYESDLDPGLDLVLGLDEEIEHLLRVNDSLSVVGHQTVDELELVAATRRGGKGGRTQ
jgi:superfamily II helicase